MKMKKNRGIVKDLGMFASISWIVLANILVGLFLGKFLDHLLNTNFIFTFVLTALGSCSGLWSIVREMNKDGRRN